jgi:hypothetical protein
MCDILGKSASVSLYPSNRFEEEEEGGNNGASVGFYFFFLLSWLISVCGVIECGRTSTYHKNGSCQVNNFDFLGGFFKKKKIGTLVFL